MKCLAGYASLFEIVLASDSAGTDVFVRLPHVPPVAPEISHDIGIVYMGGIDDKVSAPHGTHILTAEVVPPIVSDGEGAET